MLRLSLIALLLMPGIAHAQKFLKVGEPDPDVIAAPQTQIGGEGPDGAAGDAARDDADSLRVDITDLAEIELPDIVLQGGANGNLDGGRSEIYARVRTDASGAATLELATFGAQDDLDGAQSFLTDPSAGFDPAAAFGASPPE